MSSERKKVLEMLAEGKISPEDAERLLNRLASQVVPASGTPSWNTGSGSEGNGESSGPKPPLKFLYVLVEDADGEKVNIRVPIALLRTGLKLTTMLPTDASDALSDHGIDLSQLGGLHGEELIEALRELKVDVDSNDGDKVRVFCE